MLAGRLIPWFAYVEKRPAMQGCPSNGVLAIRVEWDATGEVVRISGLRTQLAREVVFVLDPEGGLLLRSGRGAPAPGRPLQGWEV